VWLASGRLDGAAEDAPLMQLKKRGVICVF